jgi:hypothetical protein
MAETNKDLFDRFAKIHTAYSMNEEENQDEFNQIGSKVLKVIHDWENKLCFQSEKAGYGTYTGNLAEKFQAEIKNHFPLIDHVGVIIKTPPNEASNFTLKKIVL